jgi:hypothetical protein
MYYLPLERKKMSELLRDALVKALDRMEKKLFNLIQESKLTRSRIRKYKKMIKDLDEDISNEKALQNPKK